MGKFERTPKCRVILVINYLTLMFIIVSIFIFLNRYLLYILRYNVTLNIGYPTLNNKPYTRFFHKQLSFIPTKITGEKMFKIAVYRTSSKHLNSNPEADNNI